MALLLCIAAGCLAVAVTVGVMVYRELKDAGSPYPCEACGADMARAPIRNTSRGLLLDCPRCGATHAWGHEVEAGEREGEG